MNKTEYMDDKAKSIVRSYVEDHMSEPCDFCDFDVLITWKSKTIQNYKYLLITTLFDQRYFELTYNGDKHEWYLDAYLKKEHCVIPEDRK